MFFKSTWIVKSKSDKFTGKIDDEKENLFRSLCKIIHIKWKK